MRILWIQLSSDTLINHKPTRIVFKFKLCRNTFHTKNRKPINFIQKYIIELSCQGTNIAQSSEASKERDCKISHLLDHLHAISACWHKSQRQYLIVVFEIFRPVRTYDHGKRENHRQTAHTFFRLFLFYLQTLESAFAVTRTARNALLSSQQTDLYFHQRPT